MTNPALIELEAKLTSSHSEAALQEIRTFSDALKTTANRLSVFNADGALLRLPITPQETQALGFDNADDNFTLLQGDLVSTEAAYFMGERITSSPKYIVLNSSCDLVPNRRKNAALLLVKEVRSGETDARAKLNLLLKFSRTDSMYLPAISRDHPDTLCNTIEFDGICQIRSSDLVLATRIASLSLVGWRMFASFSRTVLARANPRETQMRIALEHQPQQQPLPHFGPPGAA